MLKVSKTTTDSSINVWVWKREKTIFIPKAISAVTVTNVPQRMWVLPVQR